MRIMNIMKNYKIPNENHENHENPKVPCEYQIRTMKIMQIIEFH